MEKSGMLEDDATMPQQNSQRQRSAGIRRIAVLQVSAPDPMQNLLRCVELVACPFGAALHRVSLP